MERRVDHCIATAAFDAGRYAGVVTVRDVAGSLGLTTERNSLDCSIRMPRYFAFLRAINVGGHNVKMEQLRANFESLSFTKVETFIASGNVIFDSKSRNAGVLEKKIEERLHASLGYQVATFLRTDKELVEVAKYKPFADWDPSSGASMNIGFVYEPLSDEVRTALSALKTKIDQFHVHDREVYWLSRAKQSESTFSNAVFERILKGKATFRGLNTIIRLAAKYLGARASCPL